MTTRRTTTPAASRGWSAKELDHIKQGLEREAGRLREQLAAESELGTHLTDLLDETGDEATDLGTLTGDLEAEASLADNGRVILGQCQLALERISTGRYGLCDVCGEPIAKKRLQALPRATHCLACPQR